MSVDRNDQLDLLFPPQQLFNFIIMKAQDQLSCAWGVWFSHSQGIKNEASYGNNLFRFEKLGNWADFAYIWKQSLLSDPLNFFADPKTGKYTQFQLDGVHRKVESINFFRHPIEPTWEFGDNNEVGYFNFSLFKNAECENVRKIYSLIILTALGRHLSMSEKIRGIRIVDTWDKNLFRCRFEIWMDYKESEETLELISQHAQQLLTLFKDSKIEINRLNFFNIGEKKSFTISAKKQDQPKKL